MKKYLLLLALIIALQYCGFAQDIHFTTVDPSKEDPWTNITGMSQDPNGYLWIAATEGLYKYDGHQYIHYGHEPLNPNSIALNRLEAVFADKDGIIWIGTFGSGLDRFDPATGKFTHYRQQTKNEGNLPADTVTAIIQDREGTFWIGTNDGLEKFNPLTGKFKHFAHNAKDRSSISNNQVRLVYEDHEGTIWVGCGSVFALFAPETPKGEGGLNKFNKKTGKFTRYLHDANDPHSLIDNRVRAIFEDSRGKFWVGTAGDGLHTMDRKKGTFEHHLYDSLHPENLSRPPLKKTITYADDHITFINEDNSGKIWIGTFEGGVNVYDPVTQKTVWYGADPKNKIATNQFWYCYRTRDGLLWISAWDTGELYKINPYENKLPYKHIGKWVYGFLEDADKTLWIATKNGLVHKEGDSTLHTYFVDKNEDPKKSYFIFMEKDDENKLWLTTNQNLLYRFDPVSKVFTRVQRHAGNANSLISDTVIYLKKGPAGKLWVGTYKGLELMDIKTGTVKHFQNNTVDTPATRIRNNIIVRIETDKNNNVWVSNLSGLNKLDVKTGRFKRYLPSEVIYFLLNDSRDNLWVCAKNGLYSYDKIKDSFSILGASGTTSVYWATEDNEKNLWLEVNGGIAKLNLQNNELNVYGKNQGVDPNTMIFGYKTHDGEILFGDTTGYFSFYPDKLMHRAPAPVVTIDRFLLADIPVLPTRGGLLTKPIANTQKIHLNYNQSTFSFGFTGIDYVSDEQDTHTFYMLENYDSQWRKANSDETATYYNVPPGAYTFKVKSINGNGVVVQKNIAVIISPPWWQTWWAYTLFVLAFAGSVWGFIYYRSRALISEKRILEETVLLRTAEVMEQKEEIMQQKEEIEAQANQALKQASVDRVRAEIASMRTTNDLERITPLIWNELTVLGVPFTRCGVFIMDEKEEEIHTYLSTPDGKALAAYQIPFNTEGFGKDVLLNWRKHRVYTDHWDEAQFKEYSKNLVEQGAVESQEKYLAALPTAGLDLHFFPFLQGMLYVGNIFPLAKDEMNVVQLLADAFSTAYARYEDFNKLEAAKQQVDTTLSNLRTAQTQLVQSEKMASLGELTAGIAHEIQNPLNFVNNFSEVSAELINELKEGPFQLLPPSSKTEANAIFDDITENLQKITHHGKRADAIVKAMLQHSKSVSGTKEPTNINALADEYMRLAYHGLRSKDKSFNSELIAHFDAALPLVSVNPQDIGRVFLNLFNNAFYAVHEKQKIAGSAYKPEVMVSTISENGHVIIKVKDNGIGIPDAIKEKIMQPFFTTKPTGEGTGLGLSLTYDMVVKGHGGSINVNSTEGEGSEFIIKLPVS